jgi:hypothetical protein
VKNKEGIDDEEETKPVSRNKMKAKTKTKNTVNKSSCKGPTNFDHKKEMLTMSRKKLNGKQRNKAMLTVAKAKQIVKNNEETQPMNSKYQPRKKDWN